MNIKQAEIAGLTWLKNILQKIPKSKLPECVLWLVFLSSWWSLAGSDAAG